MGKQRKNAKRKITDQNEMLARRQQALKQEKRNNIIIISLAIFLAVATVVGIILAVGFGSLGWGSKQSFKATHHAVIEIEGYGTVKLELYGEEAPETVKAFVSLAESGYFNGLTFYGIESSSNGVEYLKGGKETDDVEPIYGEFQYNDFDNDILQEKGIISLAKAGQDKSYPNKFFIIVSNSERNSYIEGEYAAFGKVISGMSIIEEIHSKAQPHDDKGSILPNKQPVIKSISVHEAH